jgi:hypothetical protein
MWMVLALLRALSPDPVDVEGLRASAPLELTAETAALHLSSARLAGLEFGIEPNVLLAIAYRESRYKLSLQGPEVRGKHACGLMQPGMRTGPCPQQTELDGYREGAMHLRRWADTKQCRGDLRCALLGYSGGYALLRACAAGPVEVTRGGKTKNLCRIPDFTFARARLVAPLARPGSV